MAAIGGSIESVSIDGRVFAVAADADVTMKLGGDQNDVQANGNGTARIIKTTMPASIEGLTVEVDHDRADQEFLQDVADGNAFVAISVTFASGVTYQGTAQVTGDFASSSQNATATVNIMGPGKFTQQ